jgi:hypothetical protein
MGCQMCIGYIRIFTLNDSVHEMFVCVYEMKSLNEEPPPTPSQSGDVHSCMMFVYLRPVGEREMRGAERER